MFLFQEPPPTPYDLRFTLAGIPVRVHPLFWLITLLLGSAGDLLLLPVWVLVIFVSILVHELGHAFAFRQLGQGSRIVLHFAGGLTIPESVSWGRGWANVARSTWQDIFISIAGPGAGFLFAGLVILIVSITGGSVLPTRVLGFIPLPVTAMLPVGGWFVSAMVTMLLWVNIFWGLINLMPVQPLDGGNVARNLFIHYDPLDGLRKSLWLSVVTGALLALIGLITFNLFLALLFGLLAYQSYQSVRGSFGGRY
ncbi:MAG TPA: site-2 protease family protein [Anaerolineales bacterium]|nr:site-2 protease family protein [Anaerolineales bacterium]